MSGFLIRIKRADVEADKGCRPVERLGNARNLAQILFANLLNDARNLAGKLG